MRATVTSPKMLARPRSWPYSTLPPRRRSTPSTAHLKTSRTRLILLANRMYSLSVQDRMADAEASLATVRELAERVGDAQLASMHHPAATLYFFEGRWDDALAELDAIPDVPEDRTFVGMVHGLAALIAGRRDDRATAAVHLAAVRDDPLDTPAARLNSLPLFSARTVAAERDRDPAQAVAVLASLLDPQYAQA